MEAGLPLPKMDKTNTQGTGAMINRKHICASAFLFLLMGGASAQAPRNEPPLQPDPTTLDESAKPGANYDKADFRFWAPDGVAKTTRLTMSLSRITGIG